MREVTILDLQARDSRIMRESWQVYTDTLFKTWLFQSDHSLALKSIFLGFPFYVIFLWLSQTLELSFTVFFLLKAEDSSIQLHKSLSNNVIPKVSCTIVIISFFTINNKFGVLTLQGI